MPKKAAGLSAWSDADRKARREKEEHEKNLAQLGARVVDILNERERCQRQDNGSHYPVTEEIISRSIARAARSFGLLGTSTPEEERATPLDEERTSFQRETLERFDKGEVP